jgi:hypothetical protein
MKINKNMIVFASIISILAIATLATVEVNASYVGEIRNGDDYQEEKLIPYLDIWINMSTVPAPLKSEIRAESTILRHAAVFYASRDQLTDLYGFDLFTERSFYDQYDTLLSTDTFGYLEFDQVDQGLGLKAYDSPTLSTDIRIQAHSDENPVDYTTWTDSYVDSKRSWSEREMISEGVATYETFNYSTVDDTSLPTSSSDEFVRPEQITEVSGIQFTAGDGKTILQYGDDIAVGEGGTFVEIHNASVVMFAMGTDDLTNVLITFDQQFGNSQAPNSNAFTLRRRAIRMHQKIKSTVGKGKSFIKKAFTTVSSAFKKIGSNVYSNLKVIPAKATDYAKNTIGSAWHRLKIGIKSFTGGIARAIMLLIFSPIVLGFIILVAVIWIRRRR